MSAIAGIYRLDGQPVERSLLERMNRTLSFHGPDDSGIWADGPVGISQNTLWNTPESPYEKYPFSYSDGNFVLVADARIDNRDELLGTFNISDNGKIGDGQLILRAFEKWGETCAEKLIGDFAFVIWDKR